MTLEFMDDLRLRRREALEEHIKLCFLKFKPAVLTTMTPWNGLHTPFGFACACKQDELDSILKTLDPYVESKTFPHVEEVGEETWKGELVVLWERA